MSRSRPGFFVVRAAVLDAQFFRHRNLHVVDVAAIPEGLKNAVGEPEHQQVLHRLFAQVVIDAIDLIFVENAGDGLVQFRALSRLRPKGFSMMMRVQVFPGSLGLANPRAPRCLTMTGKKLGGVAR